MSVLLNESVINSIKYFYIFFIGASLGSFYKTLLDRIFYYFYSPIRKSLTLKEKYYNLFFQPSFCFHCKNKIKRIYVIPLFGYFLTKKRCSYCKKKLEFHYWLWEISGGVLLVYFVSIYNIFGVFFVLVVFHYLITAIVDYRKFFIDFENLFFVYLWNFLLVFFFKEDLKAIIIRVFLFIGIFLILFFIGKKKKLGFGDILLVGGLAIYFSIWEMILIINFSAIGSVIYILFYKKNIRSPAPLGFFLSISGIVLVLLEPLFLDFYKITQLFVEPMLVI
ncbi:MAG: prepilin peptidase [Leptonema sp. (in: bacteria)]